MAQQKRRMREIEHKKQVQRLWQQKLKAYKLAKEQEERQYEENVRNNNWEEEVIRREKEKILKEHIPNLQGFLPKELEKVGLKDNKGGSRTGYSQNYKL